MAPGLDFIKGENHKFVGWYLYLKSKFIEISEGDAKSAARKVFKVFEEWDTDAMVGFNRILQVSKNEKVKNHKNSLCPCNKKYVMDASFKQPKVVTNK